MNGDVVGGTEPVTNEIELNGFLELNNAFPTTGVGVDNQSIFLGTDGALYFKGGAGTVTQIAIP